MAGIGAREFIPGVFLSQECPAPDRSKREFTKWANTEVFNYQAGAEEGI
jgi:hypothetical protein